MDEFDKFDKFDKPDKPDKPDQIMNEIELATNNKQIGDILIKNNLCPPVILNHKYEIKSFVKEYNGNNEYLAKNTFNENLYIIKMIPCFNSKLYKTFISEKTTLLNINCKIKNMLCLIDSFLYMSKCCLITNYIPNLIPFNQIKFTEYSIYEKIKIMYIISITLSQLHKLNILHLYLNSVNLLLQVTSNDPYIIDYYIGSNQSKIKIYQYSSPEILLNALEIKNDVNINELSDVFSLGCIFTLILSNNNRSIFEQFDEEHLMELRTDYQQIDILISKIGDSNYLLDEIYSNYNPLVLLIQSMLSYNQLKRPPMNSIINVLKSYLV